MGLHSWCVLESKALRAMTTDIMGLQGEISDFAGRNHMISHTVLYLYPWPPHITSSKAFYAWNARMSLMQHAHYCVSPLLWYDNSIAPHHTPILHTQLTLPVEVWTELLSFRWFMWPSRGNPDFDFGESGVLVGQNSNLRTGNGGRIQILHQMHNVSWLWRFISCDQ